MIEMKSRKRILWIAGVVLVLVAAAGALMGCGDRQHASEQASRGTIKIGVTSWTCTQPPSYIMKQLLEQEGYEVEFTHAEQPLIWTGLKTRDLHFFMDAWLPYTEAERWKEFKDDLVKVSTSYEEAPLGWVVPAYVEEDSILELKGNAEKFDGKIIGISSGAAMTTISKEMIKGYGLEGFEVQESSEAAMMSVAKAAMANKEPVVFFGWRPHSMFTQFDIKFLEEPKNYFKADKVFVLSYEGIEKDHPKAHDVMSRWSINVADLEEMMYRHENEEVSWEELASEWIEENPEKVEAILGV
jgi:glycine betaine/proline transport system substrate-binding protein